PIGGTGSHQRHQEDPVPWVGLREDVSARQAETETAMEIKTTGSRIVYGNRWMRVREDRIERTNGAPGLYSVVEKLDYSLIMPRDDQGVFLVEQYRYPVQGRYWEFPQGTWEERPEADPTEVAR